VDFKMKKYTPAQAKGKIEYYCAYQERSHHEVRNKLYEYGLYSSDVEDLLSQLITDGFLNEERFAKAFAGGKFRMKKWGRIKIVHDLEAHGISKNCIKAGLKEISEEDYQTTLKGLLIRKNELLEDENEFARRDKLVKYAIQKGYESDLVWRLIKEMEVKK
jgi:regulatory protein